MHLLIALLLQFYHVDPPIVVARDTTFIAGPLRSDGLPDYEAFVRDQCRAGATPENNAAVPFWQAMWPTNLDRPDFEPMRKELGLKEIPSEKDALESTRSPTFQKRILDGLHLNVDEADIDDFVSPAITYAWTSNQFPPLAQWVEANKRPLDLLVEASRRPRYYSPSPTFLNDQHEMIVGMLLPGSQNLREAVRALGVRAMRHVGENRLDDAWNDLLAMHRFSRLVAQGPTLVEQLVAIAVAGISNDGTLALLSSDRLTPDLARRIKKDLDSLPDISRMTECIDSLERIMTLDAVVHMKLYGIFPTLEGLTDGPTHPRSWTNSISFDGNVTMRRVNRWYDRIVAIMKIRDHETRQKEFAKYETDLEAEGQRVKQPIRIFAAIFSLKSRSESIGAVLAALMLPAIQAADVAQDRGRTQLQLIRLAAAIAVYRVEHHSYPAKLDDLVPGLIAELPTDVYNSKPFIYKRTDDGYLLYSVGSNGIDDRGDNSQMSRLAGEPTENMLGSDTPQAQPDIPEQADDWGIRLPHPKFKLKALPAVGGIH
jgi:hypothetical protein